LHNLAFVQGAGHRRGWTPAIAATSLSVTIPAAAGEFTAGRRLDLANRQARARTKGGHTRPLHFQTAAARLLAKLTAGRQAGPVFLTERRAAAHRVMAAADLDPASGRARLSYEMAEQLFKRYSGGKTLHQLRHSRLTHLGEANVSAPLLMAISGHKRLATLQRYVQPSQAAVAALMAAGDPDRRGR
jgi:integrase